MSMDLGLGQMMGMGAEALGALWSAKQNRQAQRRAHKFAALMYQNRYQWTMQDMQKAGLNPILAAKGGLVGSSPGGVGMAPTPNPFTGAGERMRLAKREKYELDLLHAQEKSNFHSARHAMELANKTAGADTAKTEAETRQINAMTDLMRTQIPAAKAQMQFDETRFGEMLRMLNRAIRSATGRDTTGGTGR